MKVLIRNTKTGAFFEKAGWVQNALDGTPFKSSTDALSFILANKLEHSEIILKFEQADMDVNLPVSASIPNANVSTGMGRAA